MGYIQISIFFICLLLSATQGFAQQAKYTISGTLKDKQSGETLIGVSIRVQELPTTGTATNEYGYYSLTLPQGAYTILVSYLGYQTQSRSLTLNSSTKINISLENDTQRLNEVVISA